MSEEALDQQGFNDSELADIMDEIEGLEKEFIDDDSEDNEPAEQTEPEGESNVTELRPEEEQTQNEETEAETPEDEAPEEEEEEEEEDVTELQAAEEITDDLQDNDFEEESEVEPEVEPEEASAENLISEEENSLEEELEEISQVVPDENGEAEDLSLEEPPGKTKVQDEVDQSLIGQSLNNKNDEQKLMEETMSSTNEKTGAPPSKMSFDIVGNMELQLSFEVSSQKVNIKVDKSDGLIIEMPGGARFVLPLKE